MIVAPTHKVIQNGNLVATLGEMEGSGPAKVAVTANHKNPHMVYSLGVMSAIAMVKNTMVK
jgi:hypothetical protein